jgi:aminoglycoside 6'-N-acetyltransferase
VAAGNVASQRVLLRAGFVFTTIARTAPDNPVDPPEHRVHRRLRS